MNATENEQRRTGAEWEAFLAKYRICGIVESGDGYDVESTSGHTYHVHNEARIARDSGSMYFTWHCNCPARKRCRHIDAVVQLRWAEAAADGDYDGMDIMEREV
jgi:hypothetical protein